MRVAMIVVAMVVVTTPLEASQSCMSKTEARQHFRTSHIYWHGPDHCWDATPPRQHQVQGVRRRTPTNEARRKPDPAKAEQSALAKAALEKPDLEQSTLEKPDLGQSTLEKSDLDQPSPDQFSSRNLTLAMLPEAAASLREAPDTRQIDNDDHAADPPAFDRGTSTEPSSVASRWVEIAQVTPSHTVKRKPPAASSVTAGRVAGLLVAFVLTSGIALVFLIPAFQRRRSTNIREPAMDDIPSPTRAPTARMNSEDDEFHKRLVSFATSR
jgi:hypothetical protein